MDSVFWKSRSVDSQRWRFVSKSSRTTCAIIRMYHAALFENWTSRDSTKALCSTRTSSGIPATIRCRGKEPGSQFCAHLLPEAVSGAAAAPIGGVGGAIASAARILVGVW